MEKKLDFLTFPIYYQSKCVVLYFFHIKLEYVHFSLIFKVLKSYAISL